MKLPAIVRKICPHKWKRDGNSLLYVVCCRCGEGAIYTARQEGLAYYEPYRGRFASKEFR